jgi:hypothetical protein
VTGKFLLGSTLPSDLLDLLRLVAQEKEQHIIIIVSIVVTTVVVILFA